ncbi:intestinal mucin-like protein [Genypterus blacodes]|uniref:intestinal mucin-like protein n=1 Tax=Genypterus blacodes TaxID=154954 RepID=UPI003F76A809
MGRVHVPQHATHPYPHYSDHSATHPYPHYYYHSYRSATHPYPHYSYHSYRSATHPYPHYSYHSFHSATNPYPHYSYNSYRSATHPYPYYSDHSYHSATHPYPHYSYNSYHSATHPWDYIHDAPDGTGWCYYAYCSLGCHIAATHPYPHYSDHSATHPYPHYYYHTYHSATHPFPHYSYHSAIYNYSGLHQCASTKKGDLVYNRTDGLGWCYVAYCNLTCKIEKQTNPCGTTVPPTTTTTHTHDCIYVNPPRKEGESWNIDNCTNATCFHGHVLEKSHDCSVVEKLICANGRKVVKVYDDRGCCFHYECECVCSLWGDSHYKTFDGKSYDFKENCSFYLVKEIIPKHKLTIILTINECSTSNDASCTKSLLVLYQTYEIVLTQFNTAGTITNGVFVNDKRIYPSFQNKAIFVTGTDMAITLEIPDIDVKVVYRGSSFTINIPYSIFNGKTEGQCGTCDNSQANDCRKPNGQVADCKDSAGQWNVPGTPCEPTTTPPPTTTSPGPTTSITIGPEPTVTTKAPFTTTVPACEPAICEILRSSVFAPCFSAVPSEPYIKTCKSDICNGGNNTCASLEAYAAECSNEGICLDWRNATNGECVHKCPSKKVYLACGPTVEPTCNDWYNKVFGKDSQSDTTSTNTGEGCFCPEGTTLFNTVHKECVKECGCVGPDGRPKQPGEKWTSDCKSCMCDPDSMSIECSAIECPITPGLNCSKLGERLVTKTENCCQKQSCECDANLCPMVIPTCQPGFELNVTKETDDCCTTYECVPKGVCVYNMTEYPPGSKIPTPEVPPEPPIESPGHEYQAMADKCCGKCFQKSCIFTTPDNTTEVIQVNGTYVPPGNKCVKYTCEKIGDQFVTKETQHTCPPFDPLDCEPSKDTVIEVNGCKSLSVNFTFCAGQCGSSSIYSAESNSMTHQCECCQETKTSQKQVELRCADGSKNLSTYNVVEACSCNKAKCVEWAVGSQKGRRRRR